MDSYKHANTGLKIRDIMTRDLAIIGPDSSLRDLAKLMRDKDVGMAPVVQDRQLVGMVTDRDIVVRALGAGLSSGQTRVSQIMTTGIFYCFDDEDVASAVDVMESEQVRRLPILDRRHGLVGVLSIGDLAVDAGDNELAGETLKKVSEPARVS